MNAILQTRTLPTTHQRITRVRVQVVDGPDKGRRFLFDADPTGTNVVSGGQNNSNRIVLTDEHVSDVHFELVLHEQGVVLRDRRSLNGISMYGVRPEEPDSNRELIYL